MLKAMVLPGVLLIYTILVLILAVPVGYLFLLAWAAFRTRVYNSLDSHTPGTRFLVLIPAHDEELLLPALIANLGKLTYPRSLYSIYVIADNCTDRTAHVASAAGAAVLARTNEVLRGKGYALQWGFSEIEAADQKFDAVVVIDADSTVSSNFLTVMDTYLRKGCCLVQAYYAVQNPDESWTGAIRYAAFAGVHFLRPLAREALGFSVGLKGNGMAFRPEILRENPWSGAITEDIDLHMSLVLKGERASFAPEAVVWGEMPNTLDHSTTQHARWEQGRLQMAKKYVSRLLSGAWVAFRRKKFHQGLLLIDSVMELLIPPVSILVTAVFSLLFLGLVLLIASVLMEHGSDTGLSILPGLLVLCNVLLVAALCGYVFLSLRLANAPKGVYRSMLKAPQYVFWKFFQYVKVAVRNNQEDSWVRTARNKGG